MNETTEKVMNRKINIKVDSLSAEKSEVNTEIDLLIVQMCRNIRERMAEKEENRKICSKMDLDEISALAALITARAKN